MSVENKINKFKGVPEPTVRRMPSYLHYLRFVSESGVMNISAPTIGRDLRFDPTQVVKDLAYTGVSGKPRIGYNVYELVQALRNFLGFNRLNDAFLVGAGNLGTALLSYQGATNFGIKIIAAFDIHEDKVNTQIGGVRVLHLNKCQDLVQRLQIKIAILTTPVSVSQLVTDKMVSWGIEAIWNFTPTHLEVPKDIIVQNTSMYSNVAVLLNKLANKNIQQPLV